jgi:hypothetical protein
MIGPSSTTEEHKFRATVEVFFAFVEDESDPVRILLIAPQGNPVTVKLSRWVQRAPTAGISRFLKSYLPDGATRQPAAAGEFLKQDWTRLQLQNTTKTQQKRRARRAPFSMMSVWFDRSG